MLLRSFFRKKITKIYFCLILISFLAILLLFSFKNYYHKIEDELYNKFTTFVIESSNDSYDLLTKYNGLDNIQRVLTFSIDNTYDVFSYPITNSSINNTIISSESDSEKISTQNILLGSINNKIVVTYGDNINKENISIGLPKIYYEEYTNNSNMINNTINKKVGFYNDNTRLEFTIIAVYESKFPELKISKDLYAKLIEHEIKYTYKADITSFRKVKNIRSELQESNKLENQTVVLEQFYYGSGLNDLNKLQDLVSILEIVTYIITSAFVIFIIIINKNQINDTKNNLDLERKLGYSKVASKFNLFIRLILLYSIAFILSLILLFMICLILNKLFTLNLSCCYIYQICIIYFVVLFLTLFQSLKVK